MLIAAVLRVKIECLTSGSESGVFKFRFGHDAELHERLLPGVALEIRKSAGGEHPLRVLTGPSRETVLNCLAAVSSRHFGVFQAVQSEVKYAASPVLHERLLIGIPSSVYKPIHFFN